MSLQPATQATAHAPSPADEHGVDLRLPNFLVIGAARSGTTTLHYHLGQHPEVFVSPVKETNFFLWDEAGEMPPWVRDDVRRRTPKTLEEYGRLFAQATERHRAVGESSPSYLFGPVAARIKARLPEARLIAILRHPVEQALSMLGTWHKGLSTEQLVERLPAALASPEPGPRGALPLKEHGQFHHHLAPFFAQFDRSRIKVVLFDDLTRNGPALFRDLFRFLGVDESFHLAEVRRYNSRGQAKNAVMVRALLMTQKLKSVARTMLPAAAVRRLIDVQHRVRSANLEKTSDLSPALRRALTEQYYSQDIAALERALDRDLSLWRM
jgi:Sulfotransferase family